MKKYKKHAQSEMPIRIFYNRWKLGKRTKAEKDTDNWKSLPKHTRRSTDRKQWNKETEVGKMIEVIEQRKSRPMGIWKIDIRTITIGTRLRKTEKGEAKQSFQTGGKTNTGERKEPDSTK